MMTKKASVIMLPTDKSNLATIKETNKLVITDNNHHFARGDKSEYYLTPQHLYFTTDDEIKGKGYRLDMNRMSVGVIDDDNYYNNPANGNFKKIVATTNKELHSYTMKAGSKQFSSENTIHPLGKIPTDFIEAYVREQGRIKEVLLEYESVYQQYYEGGEFHKNPDKVQLKLRPNGTVIIHRAKERSYKAEEILKALNNPYGAGSLNRDEYRMRVIKELGLEENSI